MEKINQILDNCKGDIDVAEIARMVSELNLPLIDVLAVASGAVEHRRRRREFLENKKTTTTAAATTDHGDNAVIDVVDDDGEAVMLKHDQRLGKKRPSVSNPPPCYPRKKLKPHVEEREILFRREKDSSDETIVAETPPLPLLKQGSLEIQENVSALPNRFSYLPIKKRMTEGGFAFSDPVSEKERLMSEKALIKKNMSTEPESPPELLIETRNKITAMGGTDLKLIIQKPLRESDWLKGEGRLSIPIDQIRATGFLTNKEKSKLGTNQDGIKFELLDPNGELQTPSLRGWEMEKSNPKFVLVSKWNIVVQDNQLRMDDVIQLWSFRIDSKLFFALVNVEDGRNNNRGGSGSNEGETSEIGSK